MPFESRNRPRSLVTTYISVFAALNVLADFISFTPILGMPEAFFRLGWIISPLTGILLGAKIGGISCLIGGLIEIFLGQPPIFGPFTPLRPAISAFIAGMLGSKHWRIPTLTLFTLILVWLLLPVGKDASVVLIFHVAGLTTIVLLRGKIGDLTRSKSSKKTAWGLFLATYCGNITRHLFGNILLVTTLNMQSLYFLSAIPYTLIEQLTFAIGTMIIGVPLSHVGLREILQKS